MGSIPVELKYTGANYTAGRGDTVTSVVVHWWGDPAVYRAPNAHDGVVTWFCTKRENGGSSAHTVASYLKRTQVVRTKDTAHHAGNWQVNQGSLGLELMPIDARTPPEQALGTFRAGAEQIAVWLADYGGPLEIIGHQEVSSTSCPGVYMRLLPALTAYAESLVPYVQSNGMIGHTAPEYEGTLFMRNPAVGNAQGRGKAYGPRAPIPGVTTSKFHAGQDISNATGTPVVAAFAGTVLAVGENGVQDRTGKYILIKNPDGEGQYYGHLSRQDVRQGDTVREGQQIGLMGATGNVTGPHLHFETWRNAHDHTSHFDPMILFRKYDVAVGVGGGGGSSTADDLAIQKHLRATIRPETGQPFYPEPLALDGINGSYQQKAVSNWQKFRGLHEDGYWGGVTQTDLADVWRPYVDELWGLLTALNYDVGINDRTYGTLMYRGVEGFQRDSKLFVDGDPGPLTYRELRRKADEKNAPPPLVVVPDPEPDPGVETPQPTPEQEDSDLTDEHLDTRIRHLLPAILADMTLQLHFT